MGSELSTPVAPPFPIALAWRRAGLGAEMFIGHYGPAFGAKAAVRRVPLWIFFLAVQFMDIVWSGLVLLGVEKVRIVPGFTEGSPLDLFYMPFTHSLDDAVVLSAAFGAVACLFFRGQRKTVFIACALAVFSHWILDVVVHVRDMPLYGDSLKIGLGLWRWIWISLPLELIVLAMGAWLYARFVPARRHGNVWLWIFVAALAALEIYSAFGPLPVSPQAECRTALLVYGALTVLAGFVDLSRARAIYSR